MLIEKGSLNKLKQIRSKAKMNEFHIPEEDHIKISDRAKLILMSAIGIVGEYTECLIDMYNGKNVDLSVYTENLKFASAFFESYSRSGLYRSIPEYYQLMGAALYYLSDQKGSTKVMANLISSEIELECSSLDKVLLSVLQGENRYEYRGKYTELKDILFQLDGTLSSGKSFDYELLHLFRDNLFQIGSDREMLFGHIIIAVIYKKIADSPYRLLPIYTDAGVEKWRDILSNNTLVSDMWQSQKILGENGVFRGKSATIQMPTGSGKTKSIAIVILAMFLKNKASMAVIVAPFRALCREIADELSEAFSFTSSIEVNAISDVYQMDYTNFLEETTDIKKVFVVTPEKLLFMIRQDMSFLKKVGLMVFDEGHLFDDESRGISYELLISSINHYVGNDTQKVVISAVISNAEQINDWLTNGTGVIIRSNSIATTEKTVSFADQRGQSYNLFFVNPQNPDEEEFYVPKILEPVRLNAKPRETRVRVFPEQSNDVSIAIALRLCTNSGVAIFCGRKATADRIISRILEIDKRGYSIGSLLLNSNTNEVLKIARLVAMNIGKNNDFYNAAMKGAFVHHAGIPMGIRTAIEYAMQHKYISFIACTSTLAQGVNLPIKYLVVPSIYQSKERISIRDFQNLIGRAGRAGMYTEGTIIFTEPNVYNNKKSLYESWKWKNYKELILLEQAEGCSSALLNWLHMPALEKSDVPHCLYELFVENYADGKFGSSVDEFVLNCGNRESEKEIISKCYESMRKAIAGLESFLLFYLCSDDYDKNKEEVLIVFSETLAFFVANDDEKIILQKMIDIIGTKILATVKSPEKRFRYSKSLLGLEQELQIEEWFIQNLAEIRECISSMELLSVVFTLLIKSKNNIVAKCKSGDDLLCIAQEWIKGKSYDYIWALTKQENMLIFNNRNQKFGQYELEHVISFCDSFLGFECTLVLSALSENALYHDEKRVYYLINSLSKELKYGLPDKCSIVLYELGFNDRFIAQEISKIINQNYPACTRKEIIRTIESSSTAETKIREFLEEYPSCYLEKFNSFMR